MNLKTGFKIQSGKEIVHNLFSELEKPIIITQSDIWEKVSKYFDPQPINIFFLETLEIDALEALSQRLAEYRTVVGIGGGRAADIAKYLHWKKGIPLYQVPTIVSVDAFFTHEIAIRDRGVVKYIGNAVPEAVFVDYEIIKNAPVLLNRSGLGDILSCHTGLFDWKLASERGIEPKWDEQLADQTRGILNNVFISADEIYSVSEKGIQTMMETLNWIGHQCFIQKHSRFEEGSEHYFVYNLEHVIGKHFIHGQMVCLGVFIMSVLQENDPDGILKTIRKSGIEIRPEKIDISWDEVKESLFSLKNFVIENDLPYSIIHEKPVTKEFFEKIKISLSY